MMDCFLMCSGIFHCKVMFIGAFPEVIPCGQPSLQGCSAFPSARYPQYPRTSTIPESVLP